MLGATGLFGGLLVRRLLAENEFSIICAGRNRTKLNRFCDEHGGEPCPLDRENETQITEALSRLKPFAVVDCAGPFQYYGEDPYRFARQVIVAGAHYLDIADATDFVCGFGTLDGLARKHRVAAISGASSTPAVSAAAADVLTAEMDRVILIDTAITPGNRTRRTLSLMKAILGQIGKPYAICRNNQPETVYGWSETKTVSLEAPGKPPVNNRLASLVNTPDVRLFPERYAAETFTFRAGLEVRMFHHALSFGRILVKWRVLPTLAPFARLARKIASFFENTGSAVGGMKVRVFGTRRNGEYIRRDWDLVADDGRGPGIPTVPVSILLKKLAAGAVQTGARPSPGEVTMDEVESALAKLEISTKIHETKPETIFSRVLGSTFEELPAPVRQLHNRFGRTVYQGRAQTKGPTGLLGRIGALFVGFPRSGNEIPVQVTITADETGEFWLREFDGKAFSSFLSVDAGGYAQERFGPLSFRLGLNLAYVRLHYPILRCRLFGLIPVPSMLVPQSVAHEEVDENGRFVFDVLLKFRFGGRIAHYRGWLEQVEEG